MPTPTIKYHFGDPVLLYPWGPLYQAMEGELQTPTATKFAIKDDYGNRVVFHGDFTIDNGVVTAGTVTGFSVMAGDTELTTASGYEIPATTLLEAIDVYQNVNTEPFFNLIRNEVSLVQIGSSQDDYIEGNGLDGKMFGASGNDGIGGSVGEETIHGGKGNDIVYGGYGLDKLHGDAGKDVFLFGEDNSIDRVMDFEVKKDLIALTDFEFSALGPGFVGKDEFAIGQGTTAHHHLIYDKATGALFYDEDGNGGTAPVQFAKLSAGLNLKADHFFTFDD